MCSCYDNNYCKCHKLVLQLVLHMYIDFIVNYAIVFVMCNMMPHILLWFCFMSLACLEIIFRSLYRHTDKYACSVVYL